LAQVLPEPGLAILPIRVPLLYVQCSPCATAL